MKEALTQMSVDSIKIHASDSDCDIDGGSDGHTAAD